MKKWALLTLAAFSFLVTRRKKKSFLNLKPVKTDLQNLWTEYEIYREEKLENRFFKHASLLPLIKTLENTGKVKNQILGKSVENRSIHQLSWGKGKIKLLLWSQMHGDESTATRAIFDLLNFLTATDKYEALRQHLFQELEIHFVPMLNPDGAERWTRRNALGIDINRDARDLVTPEGKILKELATVLKPHIGFNLHDQSIYYAAGKTKNPATISFLAPAFNYQKEINKTRMPAMQLISSLNRLLQIRIPHQVGKFNDDHDPRCFGDEFQKRGIATVLIESGGFAGDPEKQFIRKLNFYALVNAFQAIATKSYLAEKITGYFDIPENNPTLIDLVLRNITIIKSGHSFKTNLAIVRNVVPDLILPFAVYQGVIKEMGDLTEQYGYDELDASDFVVYPGNTISLTYTEATTLSLEDSYNLIKEGYLYINCSDNKVSPGYQTGGLLSLILNPDLVPEIGIDQPATFLLAKDGKPFYAVVNGLLLNLNEPPLMIPNTWAI